MPRWLSLPCRSSGYCSPRCPETLLPRRQTAYSTRRPAEPGQETSRPDTDVAGTGKTGTNRASQHQGGRLPLTTPASLRNGQAFGLSPSNIAASVIGYVGGSGNPVITYNRIPGSGGRWAKDEYGKQSASTRASGQRSVVLRGRIGCPTAAGQAEAVKPECPFREAECGPKTPG